MCLEKVPGDFPAWAFRLHLLPRVARARSLGAHQSLSETVGAPGTNRSISPSAAIIDTQSVKIGSLTNLACGARSREGVKGRKRHKLLDTLGGVIIVVVTAAQVSDQAGARQLFQKLQPRQRWLQR